jgi:hypothetical protein
MLKKLTTLTLALIFLVIGSTSLLATPGPVVANLHGYIPETTTFSQTSTGFDVVSNAYNFSYSVLDQTDTKVLFVTAN